MSPRTRSVPADGGTLPRSLRLLFAPLDKAAFGAAVGTATGLGIFLLTAANLLIRPEPDFDLALLAHYFTGYRVSWPGALIGFAWAFLAGFCAGWFVAFCRNLVLAGWLFVTRTRQELAATRDFLDHI